MEKNEKRYFNSAEASQYLNVSQSMLAKRRLSGDGPRYSKLGKRGVYEVADLDQWITASRHLSTSEYVLS
jgi:hypothetical protein